MTHSSFFRPCRHYVHTEAYRVVSFLPRLFSFYPVCQRARQKTLEFLLFFCFHLVSYAPAIPRSGRAKGGSSTFSSLSIYLYTRLLLDGACIQPRRVCCVIPVIPYVNTRFELVMLNSKTWVSISLSDKSLMPSLAVGRKSCVTFRFWVVRFQNPSFVA